MHIRFGNYKHILTNGTPAPPSANVHAKLVIVASILLSFQISNRICQISYPTNAGNAQAACFLSTLGTDTRAMGRFLDFVCYRRVGVMSVTYFVGRPKYRKH